MSQASLNGNQLSLSGVLDYRSANEVLAQARVLIAGMSPAQELIIDCQQVEKSSSVGVALLLALLRSARQQRLEARIINLPPEMQKIAQVSELLPILTADA